jgi:hypothetical protein
MSDIDIEDERRILAPAEVQTMLEQYFIGPITDETVRRLTDHVARVIADPPLHGGEISSFRPENGRRGFGRAWREVLAFGRTYPRSIDLAAWLAASTTGYPAPKPYCPDLYVGRSRQHEPDGASGYIWDFEAGGRFHTDEPTASTRDSWCVHRQDVGPKGDMIWLDDELGIAHDSVLIIDLTPAALIVQPTDSDIYYKLVRA